MEINNQVKADAYIELGDRVALEKSTQDAEICYRTAIELMPEDPKAWYKLGQCQAACRLTDQQLTSFRFAVQFSDHNPEYLYHLGCLLDQMNLLAELDALLKTNYDRCCNNPWFLILDGILQWRNEQWDAAKTILNKCLTLNPVQLLESKIQWLMGMILDRTGHYQEAYDCFNRMNQLDTPEDLSLKKLYRDQIFHMKQYISNGGIRDQLRTKTANTSEPGASVFLCGFPRSGNTLMGSILNSHPQLVTRDEWGGVYNVIQWMKSKGFLYPEDIEILPTDVLSEMRVLYRKQMNIDGINKFVDKSPLQIMNLCLIWRLFPNARTIVMIRNPYDVCLSCFSQRFVLNPAMQNFLTLEDTAQTYDQVMSVAKYYFEHPQTPLKLVRYEDLIKNFENECRSVCQFLNIDYTVELLNFQQHARKTREIRTPSYYQIIQPIYRRSENRWHNYKDFFSSITSYLEPWCQYFGY